MLCLLCNEEPPPELSTGTSSTGKPFQTPPHPHNPCSLLEFLPPGGSNHTLVSSRKVFQSLPPLLARQ